MKRFLTEDNNNLENRIERQANVKFIEDYISRIDEMIEKKREFYK